jgi:lipopolysaccharide export system permease protein
VAFREHGIPVRVPSAGAARIREEQKTTAELAASSDPKDISELQWRLSLPLMVLTLTLLAVPLSSLRPREGRYARVGYAILAYFLYSNLISAARVWMEKGQLDPRLGLWWVHLLMVAVALWLLNRQSPFAAMSVRRAA